MTSLEIQGVEKVYPPDVRALHPVTLSVQPGEFLVLVGPSGCGKSTLLRLIAGLEFPTAGQIILDGRNISNLPPAERDVAMVFQSYALYPHMTVADNIGFGLRMRRVPRAERDRVIHETAEVLGLTNVLQRRPGQLSGGQQQRVALGRAISRSPRLFLFDEPLSNLDAALRASTRAELRRLHAQLKATMLYVTHDQVEAMSMADRLVVMNEGRIQQIGAPLDVYRKPMNRFVASFIGTPAMNFLKLTCRAGMLEFASTLWTGAGALSEGPVLAGFRAEHISLTDTPSYQALVATVLRIESLGNETLVTCALEDDQIVVVRASASAPFHEGARASLLLHWESAIFFDAASGSALPVHLMPSRAIPRTR